MDGSERDMRRKSPFDWRLAKHAMTEHVLLAHVFEWLHRAIVFERKIQEHSSIGYQDSVRWQHFPDSDLMNGNEISDVERSRPY